jgi:signal transduction histidine kinase
MTIRNAVADLSRLMDSTLTAERIDAGEMDVSLRNTDMEQLLRAIQARFIDLFPERRITLTLEPLDTIECDAMLIDQAIGNLVGNALKYSPADQPVELSVAMAGSTIAIAVADHGVGIPEAEQPRLFERFFRASTATTVSGSGIGLYTARQIARLHRGDITVASGPEGTVFTLVLPRQHSETP